jgi:isocitrate dehydrogenase
MFKRIGEELVPEYPDITHQHLIIDNVAHQMAKDPAQFDVIVTTNLAGDIISDLASGLVGGLGFAASGNYGDDVAIFEAVHGSAPKYAGRNVINPTALILSSVMMLRHLGESDAAQRIEDAVNVTLAEGQAVTLDVARQQGDVEQSTSTSGFADAVIGNIGRKPDQTYARDRSVPAVAPEPRPRWSYAREDRVVQSATIGVDVYLESDDSPGELGTRLDSAAGGDFRLTAVTSRGTIAWPASPARIDGVGWWSARFTAADGTVVSDAAILGLLGRISERYRWMDVQKLTTFGPEEGFTRAQGE